MRLHGDPSMPILHKLERVGIGLCETGSTVHLSVTKASQSVPHAWIILPPDEKVEIAHRSSRRRVRDVLNEGQSTKRYAGNPASAKFAEDCRELIGEDKGLPDQRRHVCFQAVVHL